MNVILCHPGDAPAAWLAQALRARGVALEVVSVEALVYSRRIVFRQDGGGDRGSVTLHDGRVLTGLVVESNAQQITLVDAKNQKTVLARDEIEELVPSPQSLMPERLLETLAPQELRDLFRYLQSTPPPATRS